MEKLSELGWEIGSNCRYFKMYIRHDIVVLLPPLHLSAEIHFSLENDITLDLKNRTVEYTFLL